MVRSAKVGMLTNTPRSLWPAPTARLSRASNPEYFSTHSNEARIGNEKNVKKYGDWQMVKIFLRRPPSSASNKSRQNLTIGHIGSQC